MRVCTNISPDPSTNNDGILTIRTLFDHYSTTTDVEHKPSVHLSLLVGAGADATLLKGPI